MNKIYISKGKGLNLQVNLINIPDNVDYDKLKITLAEWYERSLSAPRDLRNPHDLRKKKFTFENSEDSNDNNYSDDDSDSVINKLDNKTIIPIPGMLVNYENSQHDLIPHPSDGMSVPSGGVNWSGSWNG